MLLMMSRFDFLIDIKGGVFIEKIKLRIISLRYISWSLSTLNAK